MKAPLKIKHKDGTLYELDKVLSSFGLLNFLYKSSDPSYPVSLILTPNKIEKEFVERPRPEGVVLLQGYYECAITSVAMLTGSSPDVVRDLFYKHGWKVEEGSTFNQIKKVLRDLGYSSMLHESFPNLPCIFTVKSLNVKGMFHSLYFDGKQIRDPQMGNKGMLWYGADWSPEAISGFDFITVSISRN